MSNPSFVNDMQKETRWYMHFPYHLRDGAGKIEEKSTSDFSEMLEDAFHENEGFFLTENDELYYSKQELILINKVIAYGKQRDAQSKPMTTVSGASLASLLKSK